MGHLKVNKMFCDVESEARQFDSIERERESRRLEGEACQIVRENKFLIGMKPAVKKLLLGVAKLNDWQLLKTELEK